MRQSRIAASGIGPLRMEQDDRARTLPRIHGRADRLRVNKKPRLLAETGGGEMLALRMRFVRSGRDRLDRHVCCDGVARNQR